MDGRIENRHSKSASAQYAIAESTVNAAAALSTLKAILPKPFFLGCVQQLDQFLNRPRMLLESGFHPWRDAQRLMNPAEVVVHEVQGDGVRVVLRLLAESVRQPREAAHRHTHREVLALHE